MPTGPQQIAVEFRDEVSEEGLSSSLKTISGLKGIFNLRAVTAAQEEPSPKKLYVAEVDSGLDAQALLKSVRQTQYVERAHFLPTKRLSPPYRR